MAAPMKKLFIIFAILFVLLFSSCTNGKAEIKSRTWYDYFDTVITLYGNDDEESFGKIADKVEEMLLEYHGKFDIYGDGDIAKINENAGKSAVTVSDETIELLTFSVEMYDLTDGECNIAFGSVLGIWHEYRERALEGEISVPTKEELFSAAEHTDINGLFIDRGNRTVFLSDPEASLDLGAVAKGYAADKIREYLVSVGVENYAVSLGGNVAVIGGKTAEDGWRIGIEDPLGKENVAVTELFCGAVATSGSYQRYYEADGVRYHHIIDTKTLFPENEFLSVTVISDSAALSDALSTAIFNMPLDEGKAFAESRNGVSVLWILQNGDIIKTADFPAAE